MVTFLALVLKKVIECHVLKVRSAEIDGQQYVGFNKEKNVDITKVNILTTFTAEEKLFSSDLLDAGTLYNLSVKSLHRNHSNVEAISTIIDLQASSANSANKSSSSYADVPKPSDIII